MLRGFKQCLPNNSIVYFLIMCIFPTQQHHIQVQLQFLPHLMVRNVTFAHLINKSYALFTSKELRQKRELGKRINRRSLAVY